MREKWLDRWIEEKHGIKTREELDGYTQRALIETFSYAVENSSFYKNLYKGIEVNDFSDFSRLPFTYPEDLRSCGDDMVCVRPGDIKRIVTLNTSGTTGIPKRIYFTEEDQELTVDYFANGMQYMVERGDRTLILFPHTSEGSIGRLLKEGLERKGVEAFFEIEDKVDCIVGAPTEILRLSEDNKMLRPKRVLLSSDFVSDEAREGIKKNWGCEVFEHYGMTEMGLGCAVGCCEGDGYHIRENDIYIEIIDPETGEAITDDTYGEIVFTTLTRRGMPFIRYRTGDISAWINEECSCGSILKRIHRVGKR